MFNMYDPYGYAQASMGMNKYAGYGYNQPAVDYDALQVLGTVANTMMKQAAYAQQAQYGYGYNPYMYKQAGIKEMANSALDKIKGAGSWVGGLPGRGNTGLKDLLMRSEYLAAHPSLRQAAYTGALGGVGALGGAGLGALGGLALGDVGMGAGIGAGLGGALGLGAGGLGAWGGPGAGALGAYNSAGWGPLNYLRI